MSLRSHSMPNASTFAHCAAVSRMDRCSSTSSAGFGGLPLGRFVCSMAQSLAYFQNHKKELSSVYLLHHNKGTDKRSANLATFKYYSDANGEAVELKNPYGMENKEFAAKFAGVKGFRYDGFTMWVGYPVEGCGGALPVTRKIEFKSFPSRHECNAKCLNGKHNGTCECQCGGKNHGRGMFTKILEAA